MYRVTENLYVNIRYNETKKKQKNYTLVLYFSFKNNILSSVNQLICIIIVNLCHSVSVFVTYVSENILILYYLFYVYL